MSGGDRPLGFLKIPEWELNSGFDPLSVATRTEPAWVTASGGTSSPLTHTLAEVNLEYDCSNDFKTIPLRDPNEFVAGQIHKHLESWEFVLKGYCLDNRDRIRSWLYNGVNVHDFFCHFKGNFKGRAYDTDTPPQQYFPNARNCKKYVQFISTELKERIKSGAVKLLGRVGECKLPRVIMPLTVEPTKPRLCHDERYINLWIKDLPFKLDTLRDIHRMIDPYSCMVTLDEKSGYDHVLLTESSQEYFGIQFGGYIMTCCTLPFGWKASPFLYQSIGMVVTAFLRQKAINNAQYIDDRIGVSSLAGIPMFGDHVMQGTRIVWVMLQVLTHLGYTLALKKCSLVPSTCKRYLGFLADSVRMAYILPVEKKQKFSNLREEILSLLEVDLRTLQRFCGKCISMSIAVPGCKLYCREVNRALSVASKNSRNIKVSGLLKTELEHWRFLDEWSGCARWRPEFHNTVNLTTDSSGFRYGAVAELGDQVVTIGDYWKCEDERPIHLKEADAVFQALLSLGPALENSRVDLKCDNMAVVSVWEKEGGKNVDLNQIVKEIFLHVSRFNIDLRLFYVPSKDNIADAPSRALSLGDSMLSARCWERVENAFGPHTVDLMALDSNTMTSENGIPLRHFTPWPTPDSAGVNVFAQHLVQEKNPYVFPPFGLVFPVLCLLKEQGVSATVIVPEIHPLPVWWPMLQMYREDSLELGVRGDKTVLKMPSKHGFILDTKGLKWSLHAFRVHS